MTSTCTSLSKSPAATAVGGLSRRKPVSEARLEESTLRDVPSRVAAALVRAWEQQGPHIAITHQELAETVGTHRETVTRTLGEFRDRRLISLGRNAIEVADIDALRIAAGDEPAS